MFKIKKGTVNTVKMEIIANQLCFYINFDIDNEIYSLKLIVTDNPVAVKKLKRFLDYCSINNPNDLPGKSSRFICLMDKPIALGHLTDDICFCIGSSEFIEVSFNEFYKILGLRS